MGATQSVDTGTVSSGYELERNLDDANATPVTLPQDILTGTQATPLLTQIIFNAMFWSTVFIISVDFNDTEPWILTYHYVVKFGGYIAIWNYDTKESIGFTKLGRSPLMAVKFIDRKELLVAGSGNGTIYVCNYKIGEKKIKSVTNFRASEGLRFPAVTSLAVHPTKPYLLSACGNFIKLWDWDKNWECVQTFPDPVGFGFECRLTFNPNNTNSFASTSKDGSVKFWSLDSVKPMYTLSGHSGPVNCMDFFTRDDHPYLITGGDDKTAKIWDLRTQACIYTLEGFKSAVSSVFRHPTIPVLITGTIKGYIHLWSAKNFRLQRIFGTDKYLLGYRCLIGKCNISSNSVLIGYYSKLWMLEIHDEEPDVGQCSNENFE